MTGVAQGAGRTVWVVRRDEQMLEWFSIVRVANMQTVRWVLGALNGWDRPVTSRQAQSWCARMRIAGMVDSARLGDGGGSAVWATHKAIGVAKPDLYRQTTRHELAVASASARFAAAGYAWRRDEKAPFVGGHQADGVAIAVDWVELIEVELTAKRLPRYASIFNAYRGRLNAGDASQITYIANASGARAVRHALQELPAGRAISGQVAIHEVFDRGGIWSEEALPDWLSPAQDRASTLAR